MTYKWAGAIMVLTACGGFGFIMAAQYRLEIRTLRQFISLLDAMECELSYHLTPLPELCRRSASLVSGPIRQVMLCFAQELEQQICPDISGCMHYAISSVKSIPDPVKKLLEQLGNSMGRFDLSGQLKGLESLREMSMDALNERKENREQRVREYQTLGLCAGAALVIILV